MTSSQDTEITLGTGKLLVLFFGLVAICALFFALGYSLGRKSEPSMASLNPSPAPQISPSRNKGTSGTTQVNSPSTPMTFYKSVEQKDASPELTPAADSKVDTTAAAMPTNTATPATASSNTPDPNTTLPTSGYLVQVAAVSKQEDADALVDALKKKQYPAFVAPAAPDKLFRVQVGPFPEIKDAEAMRARLIGDGYSPILKK